MIRSSLLLLLALVATVRLKFLTAAPSFSDRNEDMQDEALDRELRGGGRNTGMSYRTEVNEDRQEEALDRELRRANEDLGLFLGKRQNELAGREDNKGDEVNQRAILSLEEPYGGNFQTSKRGPIAGTANGTVLYRSELFSNLAKMLYAIGKKLLKN